MAYAQASEHPTTNSWRGIARFALLLLPLCHFECAFAVNPPVLKQPLIGNGELILDWDAVDGATSYDVYMGTAAGGPESLIVTGLTSREALISGLKNDASPYYFTVKAKSATGPSASSNEVHGTPSVSAPPGNVKATSQDSEVILTWTPIGATSYEIWQATSPGSETLLLSGITAPPVPVEKLQDGTTYFFKIKSVSAGGAGAYSQEVWATPGILAAADTLGFTSGYTPADIETLKERARQECTEMPISATLTSVTKADILGQVEKYLHANEASPDRAVLSCNAWLAGYSVEIQTTNSSESIQALPKFGVTVANNSQVATAHLVKAFIPIFLFGQRDFDPDRISKPVVRPYVNSRFYNDIGLDLSLSSPISGATLADYSREELLTRYGGLANLYLSFSGRNYGSEAYYWGDRKANLDRLYWIDIFGHRQPATPKEALGYILEGIGVKALKTTLTGTSGLAAEGTAYLGVGVDGPLYSATVVQNTAAGKPAGMASIDVYISENLVNRETMGTMLNVKSDGNSYAAFGVDFSMYVTNSIGVQLQYIDAMHSGAGKAVGHEAVLSVAYNKPTGSGS